MTTRTYRGYVMRTKPSEVDYEQWRNREKEKREKKCGNLEVATALPPRSLPLFLPSLLFSNAGAAFGRVVRVAGPGQPQGRALSGEEEIVQSLLEGINAVAYPKALARRKAPKPSLVGAAAAGSVGGRAEMEASSSATSGP